MTRRPALRTYLRRFVRVPASKTTTMGLVSDGRHRRVSVAHARVWETTTKGAHNMNHIRIASHSIRVLAHDIIRLHERTTL